MDQTVAPLAARRSGPLRGTVRVPGDKSISHRALILGALTVGETAIAGLLEGEDVINTGRAMRALGATVERTGPGAWRVNGVGVAGFAEPRAARFRQFGNRVPLGHRGRRGMPDHGDLRWRCLAALAPDEALPRPAGADGRARARASPRAGGCR